MINFILKQNIILPILSWAQKFKIKPFFTYFKMSKFLGVTLKDEQEVSLGEFVDGP